MMRGGRGLLARAAALLLLAPPVSGVHAAAPCRTATATVSVTWDAERSPMAAGVVARLSYPRTVELPMAESGGPAAGRVENETGISGALFDSVVKDSDGDRVRDLVNVGLLGSGIPPGPFVRVRFDCRPDAAIPVPTDFGCRPEVADRAGPVSAQCSVALKVE